MKAKDAGLRIRLDRELRERFLVTCREQDKPAAQVIREFMRDYISSHGVTSKAFGSRRPSPHKQTRRVG